MDIQKQVDYWINTSEDDLVSARLLIQNERFLHGLFFCHLCIEKAIKAHVVKNTGLIPPKIHNLSFLLSKTDLSLTEDFKELTAILMTYLLEGRYPEYYPETPSLSEVTDYLSRTQNLFSWLKSRL
jgi:HEPN domain-containing protein